MWRWVNCSVKALTGQTKYAMATRVPRSKAIVLTLSMSTPADYYDVAACLCQVLLKKVRADDILILDSILSTPLMALRKRGFNVDRILNQQNEERLRLKAEAAKDREAQVAAAAAAEKNARESSLAQANAAGVGQPNGAQSQAVAQRQVAPNGKPYDPEVGGGAAGGAGSLLEQMRKWRGSMPGALGGGTTPPAIRSAAEQVAQSYRGGPNGPGLPQMGGGSSTVTTARPTDPERIRESRAGSFLSPANIARQHCPPRRRRVSPRDRYADQRHQATNQRRVGEPRPLLR